LSKTCPRNLHYQIRKFFNEDKKKKLAGSIQLDGVIQPIVVRRNNGYPEDIAGERRVQAIRDYTGMKTPRRKRRGI
jgi:ParB family chromosome partitioning protein